VNRISMGDLNYKLVLIIFLAAALVVLGLLLLIQRKRGRKTSRNYYVEALHALIDRRTDDALHLFMNAVRMGESSTDAYLQLGNLLREKGQSEKALQVHRGLLVRRDLDDEEQKSVIMAIAEDFQALGKTERAIQTIENIDKRRKDAEVMLSLHRLYHRSGDYDRAFFSLRDVVRLDRSYDKSMLADYLASVADSLIRKGMRSDAEKYLDQAKKVNRDSVSTLYLSGKLAMEEGDLGEAAKQWENMLQTDIGCFDEVLPLLQKALYESGRFQDLERILNRLIQRHPEQPSLHLALASFYEKKGEWDAAIRIIEDEKNLLADSPAAAIRLASLFLQKGEKDSARRVLDSAGANSDEKVVYYCQSCGHIAAVPLSYCDSCSTFGSFTRNYEEISD
jgi:lipopolysaccharide biosynthesis regulator YciM